MKINLPVKIELRRSCSGIISTQIDRTEFKAVYERSDGNWECFYITETKHSNCKDGIWTETKDTIERYPRDEKFGVSAWCGGEKSIRSIYQAMKDNRRAIFDISVDHFSQRSTES